MLQAIKNAVFTGANHLIIVTDPSGIILEMNPAAERLLGYSKEELVGKATPMMFHLFDEVIARAPIVSKEVGRTVEPGFDVFVAKARQGLVDENEWTYRRKDGTTFPVLLSVSELRETDGRLLGFVGISTDLTDRKKMEQALVEARAEARARAAAERANAAKSRFLAAASHDLRQPFQALRLFFHVLEARLTDPKDREIARRIDEAMDASEELLNALLDLSGMEAGMVQPNIGPVELDKLLDLSSRELAPQALAKGLRLRTMHSPLQVRTDPVLLRRMLRNLVLNAVRYTREGGILLGARRRKSMVRIEVWDTGIGIPEDQLDAIFEDFYQLGNPERDRSHGLGLGLSTVQRMSRLLGHRIDVRSRLGKGSVFSIEVPLVE